jgi:hypothetical protein
MTGLGAYFHNFLHGPVQREFRNTGGNPSSCHRAAASMGDTNGYCHRKGVFKPLSGFPLPPHSSHVRYTGSWLTFSSSATRSSSAPFGSLHPII